MSPLFSIHTFCLCNVRVQSNLAGQLTPLPQNNTFTNMPSCNLDATAHWEIISGSQCICKYLQPSERFGFVLPFRRRWQFNWVVMATLVPGTSLQPCDSRGFIGNTRGPWGKDRDCKQGFMAPLPCNVVSTRPSCQLPLSPGWNFCSSVGEWHCRSEKGAR